MSKPSKLPLVVVSFTSEDIEYPVDELNSHKQDTKGWQSSRFCEYPQELGFLLNRGHKCVLQQLELLVHETNIPSNIEVFIGHGPLYEKASFSRLGYVTFDKNESSNFQARELKIINIHHQASFVKLLVHRCHLNRLNLFNQVGLVGINAVGESLISTSTNHSWNPFASLSLPHRVDVSPIHSHLTSCTVVDPRTLCNVSLHAIVEEAKTHREFAVNEKNYAMATELHGHEQILKALGSEIDRLVLEKKRATLEERYDSAELLKRQVDAKLKTVYDTFVSLIECYKKYPHHQTDGAKEIHVENEKTNVPFTTTSKAKANKKKNSFAGAPPLLLLNSSDRPRSSPRPTPQATEKAFLEPTTSMHSNKESEQTTYDAPSDPNKAHLEAHLEDEKTAPLLPEPLDDHVLQQYGDIVEMFGEYFVGCLLSKHWHLRKAALDQIEVGLQQLPHEFSAQLMKQLCFVAEVGLVDTNMQVFVSGCHLVQTVVGQFIHIDYAHAQYEVYPLMKVLMQRLSDTHFNVRNAAVASLLRFADTPNIGPVFMVKKILKAMKKEINTKKKWRCLYAELLLIQGIVKRYHCNNKHGISAQSLIEFANQGELFQHGRKEIREAMHELVVAIYHDIGREVYDYLNESTAKQLKEHLTVMPSSSNE